MTCCRSSCMAKNYNELLEKYTLLCVKVANLMDQREMEKTIMNANPEDGFMNGIYAYLERLTSIEKYQARMLFLKTLYKYCFDPNSNVTLPVDKNNALDKITRKNDPIKIYLSDELTFYSAFNDYMTNIEPKFKLKFQIEVTHSLADFIANASKKVNGNKEVKKKKSSGQASRKKDGKLGNKKSSSQTSNKMSNKKPNKTSEMPSQTSNKKLPKKSNSLLQKSDEKGLGAKGKKGPKKSDKKSSKSKGKDNKKPKSSVDEEVITEKEDDDQVETLISELIDSNGNVVEI